jgi:hypothetical protein
MESLKGLNDGRGRQRIAQRRINDSTKLKNNYNDRQLPSNMDPTELEFLFEELNQLFEELNVKSISNMRF